jgi:ABC-type nitrate/sulfonate/bicarbonate transport system ATPase subunit
MQHLIRDLWRATGTTILFVTHNTREALRLGTRVIVLAKESSNQGSRVMLDMPVPQPCHEHEIPRLVDRLENVQVVA